MLACKGIFAKPSIAQYARERGRAKPKYLLRKTFCAYYTPKLYSRQYQWRYLWHFDKDICDILKDTFAAKDVRTRGMNDVL